jgi:hypothetical protein
MTLLSSVRRGILIHHATHQGASTNMVLQGLRLTLELRTDQEPALGLQESDKVLAVSISSQYPQTA